MNPEGAREENEQPDNDDVVMLPVDKVHEQPVKDGATYNPNKYRLHFEKESKAEVERRKLLAKTQIIKPVEQVTSHHIIVTPTSSLIISASTAMHYVYIA